MPYYHYRFGAVLFQFIPYPDYWFAPVLFERLLWILFICILLIALTALYWNATRAIRAKLAHSRQQIAQLENSAKSMEQTVRKLEEKAQRHLKSIEAKFVSLGTAVDDVKRETDEIECQVDTLEKKTADEVIVVDKIKHLVEVDAGDLKRIDDQVRCNSGSIERIGRHIEHLEIEVHGLMPNPAPRLAAQNQYHG